MNDLIKTVDNLKNDQVSIMINSRLQEFERIRNLDIREIFKELCFCIMTANCGAEKCIEIHEKIGDEFLTLTEAELKEKFKEYGYRFPNVRSKFIIEARETKQEIEHKIKSQEIHDKELRNWLVKNIKGLGLKEASHFLRNIGFKNCAIIDFHIVDILVKHRLVDKPKTMTKKKYLDIENVLNNLGKSLDLNMAELDLYLWYLETGKVLK
ncbi:MAG: N-glycosylase/DNA lyase [Candidatus Thorarchaeota archaeon]